MQIAGTNNQKPSVFFPLWVLHQVRSCLPHKTRVSQPNVATICFFTQPWHERPPQSLPCFVDGGMGGLLQHSIQTSPCQQGVGFGENQGKLYKVNCANSSLYGGRCCVIPHPMICEWGRYLSGRHGILSCNFSAGQGLHFAGRGAHPWNIVLEFSGKNSSHPAGKCWYHWYMPELFSRTKKIWVCMRWVFSRCTKWE